MTDSKGSALLWVGIGCGLLFLVGTCAIAAGFVAWDQTSSAPLGQARGFFGDLRRGDYPSALARTNAAYQSTHTVEAFQGAITALPATIQQTDVSFTTESVEDSTATMSGMLATPTSPVPVTVQLSRAGEHWYIDVVTVEGQVLR